MCAVSIRRRSSSQRVSGHCSGYHDTPRRIGGTLDGYDVAPDRESAAAMPGTLSLCGAHNAPADAKTIVAVRASLAKLRIEIGARAMSCKTVPLFALRQSAKARDGVSYIRTNGTARTRAESLCVNIYRKTIPIGKKCQVAASGNASRAA